jgi:hypothetical protein
MYAFNPPCPSSKRFTTHELTQTQYTHNYSHRMLYKTTEHTLLHANTAYTWVAVKND